MPDVHHHAAGSLTQFPDSSPDVLPLDQSRGDFFNELQRFARLPKHILPDAYVDLIHVSETYRDTVDLQVRAMPSSVDVGLQISDLLRRERLLRQDHITKVFPRADIDRITNVNSRLLEREVAKTNAEPEALERALGFFGGLIRIELRLLTTPTELRHYTALRSRNLRLVEAN